MITLFRRARSSVRRPRFSLNVTALEQRNLLTTGLPSANLSAATISVLGQDLANLTKRFDGANAVTDLTQLQTAITNDANALLAHPGHNGPFQNIFLQIDADELAVIGAAITDLGGTGGGTTGGGGGSGPAA